MFRLSSEVGSLCPKCGERPRRKPGAPCNECEQQRMRENRRSKRAVVRVPSIEEGGSRYNRVLNSKRYLITSAQNATPVHAKFLAALKTAAKHLEAELVVVPIRYKNPTSIWSDKNESDDWWDASLTPYLFDQRRKLNQNLVLVADVRIQPTASSPLTGFESLTGAESCIIAHPKMQFRAVASPTGKTPKVLCTTGSVTNRNFTSSKAGALGKFHHYLGALLVELDGKTFHLRQLNAHRTTGEFTDLNKIFTPTRVKKAPRALAVSPGDLHHRFKDSDTIETLFGPDGMVEVLQPKHVIFNDTLDGYSINPHHGGNPFIAVAKRNSGFGDVRQEVVDAIEFLKHIAKRCRVVVVPSNHDNFLSRWIVTSDWKQSPVNARFYLETALAMLNSTEMTSTGTRYADPFKYWVDRLRGGSDILALNIGQSFVLAGIENGLHGDRGPGGARGSLQNLSRLGSKVNSGHSHTPGIRDGHYQAGTSTKELEYTIGSPSAWLNTSIVTYASGARTLITSIGKKWRLAR